MHRSLYARPRLETLEDRLVPAAIDWVNPAGGDWDVPSNWSQGRVPTRTDEVTIAFSDITVTHSQTVNDQVASVTTMATLDLTQGILRINGTSSVGTLHVNGGTLLLSTNMLRVQNFVETAGTTELVEGNLASNNPLQIQGGTLIGYGQVGGNLVNAGVVQPNGGNLSVNGNYTQTGTGRLQIPTMPPIKNELMIQGTATLNGLLHVFALDNLPGNASVDPILTAGQVMNRFTTVELDAASNTFLTMYSRGEVDVERVYPYGPDISGNLSAANPPPGAPGQGPQTNRGGPGRPPPPFGSPMSQNVAAANTLNAVRPPPPPPPSQANQGSQGGNGNQGAQGGPGIQGQGPGGGGGKPGQQPAAGGGGDRPGGSGNPGGAMGPNLVLGNGPLAGMRDMMFADRRGGAETFEAEAELALVDAFALTFDFHVTTGEEASLGVEAAVSLLAGGSRRANIVTQRDSSVAAVATLLIGDDDSPRVEETEITDGFSYLLINPIWNDRAEKP